MRFDILLTAARHLELVGTFCMCSVEDKGIIAASGVCELIKESAECFHLSS